MRLSQHKRFENQRRNKGIGGLIRGGGVASSEDFSGAGVHITSILSPAQIVSSSSVEGDESQHRTVASKKTAPAELLSFEMGVKKGLVGMSNEPAKKKKGALFEWLEMSEKEKEDNEMRKREKMEEIHMKRQLAKKKDEV